MNRHVLKEARERLEESLQAGPSNSESRNLKQALRSRNTANFGSLTNVYVRVDDVKSRHINLDSLNNCFIYLGDLRNQYVNINSMNNCTLSMEELRNTHINIYNVNCSTLAFEESRNSHFNISSINCSDLSMGEMRNCHLNIERVSGCDALFDDVRNSHINVTSASDVTTTYTGESRNSHWNVPGSFGQPPQRSSTRSSSFNFGGSHRFGNMEVGGNINVGNIVINGRTVSSGGSGVVINGGNIHSYGSTSSSHGGPQVVVRTSSNRSNRRPDNSIFVGRNVIIGGNTRASTINMSSNGGRGSVVINGQRVDFNGGGNVVINNGNVSNVFTRNSFFDTSSDSDSSEDDEAANERPSRGLSAARIGQFEHFTAGKSMEGQQCNICFENLVVGTTEMVRLDCSGGHVMCKKCVTKWLSEHRTCPTCRHVFT